MVLPDLKRTHLITSTLASHLRRELHQGAHKRVRPYLLLGLGLIIALNLGANLGSIPNLGLMQSTSTVWAQTSPNTASTAPQHRLQISPLRTELSIAPGTTHTGFIKLKNTGTEPLQVELSAEAFAVSDENYDYTFLPDDASSSWVHFATASFTLEPGAIDPVEYVISVPINAEPGGAYLSLFAASAPTHDDSIQSTDRVGSLLYITVGGDVTRQGSLLSFSVPFAGTGDTTWETLIHNTGSAHFSSDYSVQLQNLWGGAVSQETTGSSLILPNSIRRLQGTLPHPQWLGLYVVHYSIPLGDNATATGTRPYLYLPVGQVAALLALILAGLLTIRATHHRQRKHLHATEQATGQAKTPQD